MSFVRVEVNKRKQFVKIESEDISIKNLLHTGKYPFIRTSMKLLY